MTRTRTFLIGLLVCTPVACSNSDEPGKLIVEVTADRSVTERLARLEVSTRGRDAPSSELAEPQTFRLTTRDQLEDGAVKLPYKFAVQQGDHDEIVLVVEGYTADDDKTPAIERKVYARFESGKAQDIRVYLARTCFQAKAQCTQTTTCAPTTTPTGEAGSCVDVTRETDPAPPADSDVQGDELLCSAEQAASCPEDYPCVPSLQSGFSCRGQFADWPIAPSADIRQEFDYTTDPEVVVDKVTGLVWQRMIPDRYPNCSGNAKVEGDSCTWQEAKDYCASLTTGGRRWRMPTKVELESIVGNSAFFPAFDMNVFLGSYGGQFWTASPYLSKTDGGYTVLFGFGLTMMMMPHETGLVRCVRGVPSRAIPAQHYVLDSAADTVLDTRTKLMWQRGVTGADSNTVAANHCAQLGDGWRLPNAKELLSLTDPTHYEPAVDPIFAGATNNGFFWSSARTTINGGGELMVGIADGITYEASQQRLIAEMVKANGWDLEITSHVRCVRHVPD